MANRVINYEFGDMKAVYIIDEKSQNVELMLIPLGEEIVSWDKKRQFVDSLVQVKLSGDVYPAGYAGGNSMRGSESTLELKFDSQEKICDKDASTICTILKDARGYTARHYLTYRTGDKAFSCYTTYENNSDSDITLEMLSSFSLGGITPFSEGDAYDSLVAHRLRSVWAMEGRHQEDTIEDLQLEPSWAGHAVREERFGSIGSMPVDHFFPFLVIEDKKNKIYWGAQLGANSSWQMEMYRRDDALSISGGIADREFGGWLKVLKSGEMIETPHAILSVCKCKEAEIDTISQRMTSTLDYYADNGPKSEQELPVVFNEYCTTWGNPSHENILDILGAIKGHGFGYFVIDCGWYKEEGIPWDRMMGDYNISKALFPNGLDKTVAAIKDAGLKPGLWFEIENVGDAARAYNDENHLLKRDGKVLSTASRRFWDMRQPYVIDYLSKKVIGTLRDYGFEYMKMDYNDSMGLGCDGDASLEEGLRQNMNCALSFVRKVKEEIPGIILENCASGGHRLEPLMMSECAMASFSDAHECEEVPVIAANLHRAILPRQSQIWAVIRKDDSEKRIAYTIINTFLGRMGFSGDVWELSESQWKLIDDGISFYKKISSIIKNGFTRIYGTKLTSYRHLKGYQGVVRYGEKDAYALFHVFHGDLEKEISIPVDHDGKSYEISGIYTDDIANADVRIEYGMLVYKPTDNMKAVAVYLKEI